MKISKKIHQGALTIIMIIFLMILVGVAFKLEKIALKVTRPSFFGGVYHPTLKLSGIPTFTFIVSLTHRMDNI